jgi:hypothetical protein
MKTILMPFFKTLLVVILLLVCLTAYIIMAFLILIWDFKLLKYSEYFNNHDEVFVRAGVGTKRHDNNVKATIIRFWNLDFYI